MLYEHLVSREPIDKGWSGDQKYHVYDSKGQEYLLRISPIERYDRKHSEFQRMQQVAAMGIPMCLPIEFGICENGVYSLQSWVAGPDMGEVISSFSIARQYVYGSDAGRILKKLHRLPAPQGIPLWADRFNQKINRKIEMYTDCPLKYERGEAFLEYIEHHRYLLADRPQSYQHGDYHTGNMMLDQNGILTIIDFDRDDYGDPWEEFNRIVWCVQDSPAFASGMVDGYFDGNIPTQFWDLLALYICTNTLSSLPWAIPYGKKEIDVMKKQAAQVLTWYDGMCRTVPSWYLK